VRSKGGEIYPMRGSKTLRVWKRFESQPGLSMTRSMGDEMVKSLGVIGEPDVQFFEIQNDPLRRQKIVIASDGVWDVMGAEEVGGLLNTTSVKGANVTCEAIVHAAEKKWGRVGESENGRVDDITCIVIDLI